MVRRPRAGHGPLEKSIWRAQLQIGKQNMSSPSPVTDGPVSTP